MKLSRIHDEKAQGVVEFALIASVLVLLFVGTVDFARFLYYDTAIKSAARVGAEMASNHCLHAGPCADINTSKTATADAYVLWSTYCEASPYLSLSPSYPSCTPGTAYNWVPTCGSLGCTACTNDICVSPSTRQSGTQVTVSVGYKFHPISFLLDWIFSTQQCWTSAGGAPLDDSTSNGHTLCASSVGKVE
jgi:Flp pilus assembly protein TadG